MKVTSLLLLTIFLMLNHGQTTNTPQILIEVQKESAGMVSRPGNYLYLRVASGGQSEFDALGNMGGTVRLTKKLSSEQTQRLSALVARQDVSELKEQYEGAPAIDHFEIVTFVILRGQQQQKIRTINFCPDCKDVEYPQPLIDLVCEIKALRVNGDIRLAKLDPSSCRL